MPLTLSTIWIIFKGCPLTQIQEDLNDEYFSKVLLQSELAQNPLINEFLVNFSFLYDPSLRITRLFLSNLTMSNLRLRASKAGRKAQRFY